MVAQFGVQFIVGALQGPSTTLPLNDEGVPAGIVEVPSPDVTHLEFVVVKASIVWPAGTAQSPAPEPLRLIDVFPLK